MERRSGPKVAVVGCGPWGRNLADAFAQNEALDSLVDESSYRADQLADELSSRGYNRPFVCSWEDALANTSIDAIALATPAPLHSSMAIAAFSAKKHVFIEKPFALTLEDAIRIQQAATSAERLLLVGHLFQYHPAFVKLKNMIEEGRLGRILHIDSRRLAFGRIREREDVFWSLGPHDISMILALAGEMPAEVTAHGFHHLRPTTADVATANLRFSSGTQAHIMVSWLHPQKERKLTIIGELATIVFDDCEKWQNKLRLFKNSVEWPENVPRAVQVGIETVSLEIQQPLVAECQHFLDCLENNHQPLTNGTEALRVVEVLSCIEAQIRQSDFMRPGRKGVFNHSPGHSSDSWPKLVHPLNNCEPIDHDMGTKIFAGRGYNINGGGSVSENLLSGAQATPDRVPLINLQAQMCKIQEVLDVRMAKVFNHHRYILGPEVHELEVRLAQYCGVAAAITCGSGTAALTLALMALGLQRGDAVIMPDLSFVATAEPVVLLGGIPIFVDVETDCLTINPSLIDAAVTAALRSGHRAVGIIAVDLHGHPADYDELHKAASPHALWIIGDAAQSFGARLGSRKVGSLAHVTTTSFFPSKPLGCYGDGGAVLTDNMELAQLLRSLRQHGLDKGKSNALRIGLNSRLDTIQAAVLLCKMDVLDEELAMREQVAKRYAALLKGGATGAVISLPKPRETAHTCWASYTVRVAKQQHRDFITQYLDSHGIATAIYYPLPFHKQTAYQTFSVVVQEGPSSSSFSSSVAEQACAEILSLPMNPYLTPGAQEHIASTLRDAVRSAVQ